MTKSSCFLLVRLFLFPAVSSALNSRFSPGIRFASLVALASVGLSTTVVSAQTPTPVPVTTWRYDLTHAGQNIRETALSPANVNVNSFGKLFSLSVDSSVYAQPLYIPGLKMNDGLVHNVLFVATENDSIYAFDADSNGGTNAAPIWKVTLLDSAHGASAGAIAPPWQDNGSPDVAPTVGITGTPAIDPATNTMYVVGSTKENGTYFSRLHAINIITGAEQPNSPVEVNSTVAGTGNGSSGGLLSFSALWENQRIALNFYKGHVYFGYGAHGDLGPWHGWLFAYDATTLKQTAVLCLAPNGAGAGLWASGAGMPIDEDAPGGRMFIVTGNGTHSAFPPFNASSEMGESVVALNLSNGGLTPTDGFTPFNFQALNNSDWDLGSGGLLMVPDNNGPNPHMVITAGKEGRIVVLNRDNLGGNLPASATSNTNALQDISTLIPQAVGFWSTAAYWNGNVYLWAEKNVPMLLKLNNGILDSTPSSKSTITSQFPDPSFSISSNGTLDGIAWALRSDQFNSKGAGVLYAWNANDLTSTIYQSDTNSKRDAGGPANKFSIPVVTNGKVYVAANGQVDVYGLFNNVPNAAAPTITPNGGTFSTSQNVQLSSATGSASIYYTLDGSAPTPSSTLYTAPIPISTNTTIKAIASAPGFVQSGVSTATFAFSTQTPAVIFAPAGGTYANAQSVQLTVADASAKIYYTIDGSTPSAASTLYAGAIPVAVSETIKAIAIDPALMNSNIGTQSYVIQNGGATIDFSGGFSSTAGLTLNGSAVANNDTRLQLTDGGLNEAGSVFWNTPISVQAFTTTFEFQISAAVANGFTFTLQNVGPTALGGNSAGLGYQDIQKSVAVKFNFYDYNGEGSNSTGLYINGQAPVLPSVDISPSGILLNSGDGLQAQIDYDGTTLTLNLLDVTTNARFTYSWKIDIPSTIGSQTAYVGFTGGSGGSSSSQKLLTWKYATESIPPVFTPAPGTYGATQNVTLSSATSGATIFYTADGSTPNGGSTKYSAPISVSATETLKAIAISPTFGASDVVTAPYVIQNTQPAATFALSATQVADVAAGSPGTSTISVTPANGFTGAVTLGCVVSGGPTGAVSLPTCSLTQPTAITGTQPVTATLTINTQATTSPGAYIATVRGTAGSSTNSATAAFTVTGSTVTPQFGLSGAPVSIASPGANGTSVITVTPTGGFTGLVQLTCAVSGGPTGATEVPNCALIQPTAITGLQPVTATLTITTQTATPAGTYTATISGTAGSLTGTTHINVMVGGSTATPDFALAGTAVSLTSPGTSGTSTITVSPSGGLRGDVALSCTVSGGPSAAVDPPGCSFGQPATVSGTGAVTSTMTVTSKSTTTPGDYTATVTGTAGSVSHTSQLTITVNGTLSTPSFSLSGPAANITVSNGQATSTITVTPSGGFTGTVTLACALTSKPAAAANPPSCSITQPPPVSGTGPVTATLTISTNSVLKASVPDPNHRALGLGGGTISAAILLFVLPFRRRKWRALIGMLLLAVIVATATGCGGNVTLLPSPGTYTVMVTGTSGAQQSAVAVNFVVQ